MDTAALDRAGPVKHHPMLKRIATFTALAFATSWTFWFLAAPSTSGGTRILIATIYMFGPFIGAVIATALFDRGDSRAVLGWRWKLNRWWVAAWLLAGLLALAANALSTLVPGIEMLSVEEGAKRAMQAAGQVPSSDLTASLPSLPLLLALGMIAGIFPNAVAAFGEEVGWRGYLWSVARPLGFWRASLVVGSIWGLWHAPLIAFGHNYGTGYAGFPWSGILMMTAFCIGLSPIMGLLRDRTGSSIPAAIFHGTINAVAGIGALLLAGADIWTMGLIGVPGLLLLALLSGVIALAKPKFE